MNIAKVERLHIDAKIPALATKGAACFDLHALNDCVIRPSHRELVATGIAIEVPDGFALMIYGRSGNGFKHGIRLAQCVGVVDSDYRGQVYVPLANDGHLDFAIKAGDRIAQAMIIEVPKFSLELVEELGVTDRGAGGFGSTGS